MSLLIKRTKTFNGIEDIYIKDGRIAGIGDLKNKSAVKVIDGHGKAAAASMVNAHTHGSMTLLRNYADDMDLHSWLSGYIWPMEAKMTDDDYYWGMRLACLEMLKSGTTCFHDMYFRQEVTFRAVADSGLRGVLSYTILDLMDKAKGKEQCRACEAFFNNLPDSQDTVTFNAAAHSVYATSTDSLRWLADFTAERNISLHIHLAETKKEYEDCISTFGRTPTAYLDKIGVLKPNMIAAHCIYLNKDDIQLLADNNITVVHNPVSNMKLASGKPFPYPELKKKGVTILLGTDSAASNNNLDLFEEMKTASLLQKHSSMDSTLMNAEEIFKIASLNGHRIFKTGAGTISTGSTADLMLIDLNRPEMTPLNNLHSALVYAASGNSVDAVICNGKILMSGRVVKDEKEILKQATITAKKLLSGR